MPHVTPMPHALDERKPDIVERFQLTVFNGGKPIWNLNYHESKFDEI